MTCEGKNRCLMTPIDLVANMILLSVYRRARIREKGCRVCHCSPEANAAVSWGDFIRQVPLAGQERFFFRSSESNFRIEGLIESSAVKAVSNNIDLTHAVPAGKKAASACFSILRLKALASCVPGFSSTSHKRNQRSFLAERRGSS